MVRQGNQSWILIIFVDMKWRVKASRERHCPCTTEGCKLFKKFFSWQIDKFEGIERQASSLVLFHDFPLWLTSVSGQEIESIHGFEVRKFKEVENCLLICNMQLIAINILRLTKQLIQTDYKWKNLFDLKSIVLGDHCTFWSHLLHREVTPPPPPPTPKQKKRKKEKNEFNKNKLDWIEDE